MELHARWSESESVEWKVWIRSLYFQSRISTAELLLICWLLFPCSMSVMHVVAGFDGELRKKIVNLARLLSSPHPFLINIWTFPLILRSLPCLCSLHQSRIPSSTSSACADIAYQSKLEISSLIEEFSNLILLSAFKVYNSLILKAKSVWIFSLTSMSTEKARSYSMQLVVQECGESGCHDGLLYVELWTRISFSVLQSNEALKY
jgi:hypothetical protein